MTALLSIEGVEAAYGKIVALRDVDLTVNQGEIVTLIGANGAGKSTLMMTIFGSPRARKGRVVFDGRDITTTPTHEIARLGIAQSPEGRRIFARMTVYENLQMGAAIDEFAHFDEDLARVYTLFPRLKERRRQLAGTLSGGERQMLALGRALMAKPRLLLLDEPSLGLAPLIVREIFHTIASLRSLGISILLVEQNARAALETADYGYVLETGQVTQQGKAADLIGDPKLIAAYLGGH